MYKSSALTHASVGVVKSWFLEGGQGLSNIPSSSLIKAFFGIPGDTMTPITVTDGIVHSAGGNEFRSILVDKTIKGRLWTFTTDFNVDVTFNKVLNADKTGYLFKIDMITPLSPTQKQVRSLMQYSARGITFFDPDCVETVDIAAATPAQESVQPTKPTEPRKGFSFTTGEENKDALPPRKNSEPLNPVTRSEAAAIAADTRAQAEAAQPAASPEGDDVGGDEAPVENEEREPITPLEEEDEEEENDMTTEKITAFVNSLITNLGDQLNDDNLLAGFQYVFHNASATIDRSTVPGKAIITVSDEGREVQVQVDDWQKPADIIEPEPEPEPEPAEEVTPPANKDHIEDDSVRVDGSEDCELGVRISNTILAKAHELLKSGTIYTLVDLEDRLHDAWPNYDFNAHVELEGGYNYFHVVVSNHVEDEQPMDEPVPPAEEEPTTPESPVDNEKIREELAKIEAESVEHDVIFEAESLSKDIVEKITESLKVAFSNVRTKVLSQMDYQVQNISKILENYLGDAAKSFEYLHKFDEQTDTLRIEELVKVTAETNIVLQQGADIVFTKGDEDELVIHLNETRCVDTYRFSDPDWEQAHLSDEGHYTVNRDMCIKDFIQPMSDILDCLTYIPWETEPVQKEEPEVSETEAQELQEAMTTPKETQPITVDPNYIDLEDRDTRDRVIQVLFPGVTDPAITHLLNFLRDHHTEEQTPSYLATKTFPTETTIVYSNLTFSIVKMKEGRYWRIFCARTDVGLNDHTWLATKNMYGRWHQLGNDIANTTDFVRQNNGVAWRRRNNNA